MKGAVWRFAGLGLAIVVAAPTAAQPSDGFGEFWTRFKAAVARDDRQAEAAMVVLSPTLDQAEPLTFARFHADHLGPRARRCLATAKPVRDTDGEGQANYSAFCGELIYVFERVGGAWKLTDVAAND